VLAAVASRLGNARWGSPWSGWAEPPVLWCSLVGLPSSGKSSGMDEAADALAVVEAEANEDWEGRQREYRTRRQEARERRERWQDEVKAAVKNGAAPPLEPEAAREPAPPARRRIVTSDATIEKAGHMAAQNPRGLLLLRDELAGWLGGMGRYSGAADADRAFWIAAYGGRRWMLDRVKDGDAGVTVPHLTFGIVGTIQPDRVASLLLAGDDDGLASRFLCAWPARRNPTRPTRPPPTGRLVAALRRVEAPPWHPPQRGLLPFTEAAAAHLQEWREEAAEMAADASGLFLSWVGKLPGFALRLAVVFQHLDWLTQQEGAPPPAAVDADAVVRAIGFLSEYAVPMARRVFGEAALPEAERDARRLARWWLRQDPRPDMLNAKAQRRLPNGPGIPTAERMDAALADLAAAGWCRAAPFRAGEVPGRSRKDWEMNPALGEVRP
ncbi:MAG: YfjI family protein, partial [Acetobacteraceae bacterium]|nr:YfjI family protein [Acetobacteraceae bacterium]